MDKCLPVSCQIQFQIPQAQIPPASNVQYQIQRDGKSFKTAVHAYICYILFQSNSDLLTFEPTFALYFLQAGIGFEQLNRFHRNFQNAHNFSSTLS